MTGHVLEHRQHAARQQAIGGRTGVSHHRIDVFAKTAVAQERMRLPARDVTGRRAIAVDADGAQLGRLKPRAQPNPPRTAQKRILKRRRPVAPMGRPQALHPPALLIDKDRRIPPQGRAQIGGQAGKLRGIFDIAGKQDQPPRVGRAQKGRFIGAQHRPLDAQNRGATGGYLITVGMQFAPSATSAAQN